MAAKDRGLDYQRVLADSDAAAGRPANREIPRRQDRRGDCDLVRSPMSFGPASRGDLVRRLRRHHRAAARDAAAQRAAICDRQGADRCRDRLHQRQARRQGQRRPADAGHDAVSDAALRGDARRAERACRASPSWPISRRSPVTKQGGLDDDEDHPCSPTPISTSCSAPTRSCSARSQALRAAGKDRPDQFLGGIDGEPEAVAEIKKGDSPYKASIALSSPVFGYAMGEYARRLARGQKRSAGDGYAAHRADPRQHRPVRGRPGRSGQRSLPTRSARRPTSRCTATSATTRATST